MAVNHNKYAIVDFETGGTGEFRQPLSIGIVILDPRRLKILDNGVFYSKIRPSDDHEKHGLDPIEQKALDVNKLTLEELAEAPPPKVVWNNVINFMKYHNPKGGKWDAPIFTGWNYQFDYQIVNRLIYGNNFGRIVINEKLPSKTSLRNLSGDQIQERFRAISELKEPYKFGGETIFRPAPQIDVMQTFFLATESFREPLRASLDAAKEYLSFHAGEAHNALVDALWTAEIFARFLRIQRQVSLETEFKTNGESVLGIQKFLENFQNSEKK